MSAPIIHTVSQGSPEWLSLRLGKPTASELGNLVTNDFKARTGDTPKTYLYEKVAEKWRGQLLPGFSTRATEQGTMREDEAVPWFREIEMPEGLEMSRVGFIETADGKFGCSPDALVGEDSGLEIKCPENPAIHLRYLLDGVLPDKYAPQVHGSMYATGRKSWWFMSYMRGFPKLVLEIKRDEEVCNRIADVLAKFHKAFDESMEQLRELDEK